MYEYRAIATICINAKAAEWRKRPLYVELKKVEPIHTLQHTATHCNTLVQGRD